MSRPGLSYALAFTLRRLFVGAAIGRGLTVSVERMIDPDFLATIQIFSFFTRPELEAVQKLFTEVSFDKDDVVVRIGGPTLAPARPRAPRR